MVGGVFVLPFFLKRILQVGTKALQGWRRVSTSHRLGHGRWGWDGRHTGCLLPPARLHKTREQISKWCSEVLKGNQGSMSQVDQLMSLGCGVGIRENYHSWGSEPNKVLRKEIKKNSNSSEQKSQRQSINSYSSLAHSRYTTVWTSQVHLRQKKKRGVTHYHYSNYSQ